MPTGDGDDTIRVPRGAPVGTRRLLWAALALVALAAGGGGFWLLNRPAPPAPPPAATQALPPLRPPARFAVRTEGEAAILANRASALDVFRFAPDPRIVVLDFPDLRQQGLTFNRVAALTEKSGTPHDRVLTDAELDAAIRAQNATVETYYYGHDYSAAELARFFALADAAGLRLDAQEATLRALLTELGLLAPGAVGAVITLPREGSGDVDAATRATILHHELSHGAYFTDPVYAGYVRDFWRAGMTEDERGRFAGFLADQGYDKALPDLTINEMQAYLMHTPDPRFFNAAAVGLSDPALAALQARFRAGMPPGWLRDATPAPATPAPAAASVPARGAAPRQRSVVSRRASAARRAPRPRAASIAV